MIKWYNMAFEKYADFEGRSTRNEFWWFFLCNALILIGISRMGGILHTMTGFSFFLTVTSGISSLYSLAVFVPNLAVTVRRLHDTGRSGWSILYGLIPVAGFIMLIIFLTQESQLQNNKWGSNTGNEREDKDDLENVLIDYDKDIV